MELLIVVQSHPMHNNAKTLVDCDLLIWNCLGD